MAIRKPLVIVNGQVEQIQSGDTLEGALPAGGTTDQILAKNSNTDFDTKWEDAPSGGPTGPAGGDLSGTYPNPTVDQITASLKVAGILTVAPVVLTLTDYDPGSNDIVWLRIDTTSGGANLNSLVGGVAGRMLWITNIGPNAMLINPNSGGVNQFLADYTYVAMPVGRTALLIYDAIAGGWRVTTGTAFPVGGTVGTNDLAGSYPSPTVKSVSAAFKWAGAISDSPSTNQDNYQPTGYATANLLLLTPGASIDITGWNAVLGPGNNNYVLWVNLSTTNTITLKNQTTSSTLRRFACPGGVDYLLRPLSCVAMIYETSRWRIFGDTQLLLGTGATNACAGNDSRLTPTQITINTNSGTTPAADGTYTPVTSITIKNGVITAIS